VSSEVGNKEGYIGEVGVIVRILLGRTRKPCKNVRSVQRQTTASTHLGDMLNIQPRPALLKLPLGIYRSMNLLAHIVLNLPLV
jgi:hypothetical protein